LFGIEAIGMEIENPFGRDYNDLPLDTICETMKRNIDDLTKVEPITR
jgi:putative membrane protein